MPGAEIYPAPANKSLLPGLPKDYTFGAAGYVNGGLLYCGGMDSADPVLVSISSCFSLAPSALGWEESSSMLQVPLQSSCPSVLYSQAVQFPSSAVIEDGRALWVLGGYDKDKHLRAITQIVRPGQPTEWGPVLTEEALGLCSTSFANRSVIVTGGKKRSTPSGSNGTEVYSFSTKKWSTKAQMRQKRSAHSCGPLWLDPNPDLYLNGIIASTITNSSVLSVVVAGGKESMFL